MTADQLMAEAQALVRPSWHLRMDGPKAALAAVWEADHSLEFEGDLFTHRISVSCKYLPQASGLRRGCVSLYIHDDDPTEVWVLHEPKLSPKRLEGLPLYAHAAPSLPPLEGIMHFGSSEIESWLTRIGSSRTAEYAPRDLETEAYLREWQKHDPLLRSDVVAVVGGWHCEWGYGDWHDLAHDTLLFRTQLDAEPWYEVWLIEGEFHTLHRVT